jgi:uncharacterized protein CbrC (UPF0167 family)
VREVLVTIANREVVNKKDLKRVVEGLPDGRYTAKFERKDKRSTQQNRYLHGVMIPIIKDALREAGWNEIKTMEDAKDFVKIKFLKYDVVNEKTGEVVEMYRNTSALTKMQFMELLQDVQIWLLDFFNINLPMPGEQTKMFTE